MASTPFPPRTARQPEAQAASVFETPLIIDQLADASRLNSELKQAIERRRAEDEGVQISNVGGWHSDTRMLQWGGEPARRLCDHVIAVADRFTVDIKAGAAPQHRWAPEMWANVSPPGASNRIHCHPGSFWSAVYYVDDGYDGSPDKSLGGELVLIDPRWPMVRMTAPNLRFRRPGQSPDHDEARFRPASGRLVMFPSWLNHEVLPYKGKGTRISIAINLTAAAIPIGG